VFAFFVSKDFRERHYCISKLVELTLTHKEEYKWFNVLSSCIYLDIFFS